MWRYLLRRDDEEPAPWTKEGKDRMKKLGLTMQVGCGTSSSGSRIFLFHILSENDPCVRIETAPLRLSAFSLWVGWSLFPLGG